MSLRLAALLLAAAAPALGADTGVVRRGDLIIDAKVAGTVVTEDVFRLKSTIEGRVESVIASSGSWHRSDEILTSLADKELAAMLDARGTQNQEVMQDRWASVYPPSPVRCPNSCYVLKIYAKKRAWVKPNAVLFEAAAKLKMIGRVRPEDVPLIYEGMPLTFWDVKNPSRKLTARIENYVFDTRSEREDQGASFTMIMPPDRSFPPGTEWEGEIIAPARKDVLLVPTDALIIHNGFPYLAVRVSTGLTTAELTEVTAGIDENHKYLKVPDSALRGSTRHAYIPREAMEKRESDRQRAAGEPAEEQPAEGRPAIIDNKRYGGEDPYGDQ
ncbi:MAG: hypothetical protein ACHQ49_17035 [Elusimicrobiota bacterium]